jgi:hypothetical protein
MSLVLTAVLLAKLPLVVRTYDSAGVAPRALEHAQDSARATLASIGIEPIWRPCHATLCVGKPPKPHLVEVEIRLVNAPATAASGSLGYAAVDVEQHAGTLATVYVDRIVAMAAQSGADVGELIGRVVAHEIGHLMLGTAEHAPFGLMRATWTAAEIRRWMPLDWRFTVAQGAEMRLRLLSRDETAGD